MDCLVCQGSGWNTAADMPCLRCGGNGQRFERQPSIGCFVIIVILTIGAMIGTCGVADIPHYEIP